MKRKTTNNSLLNILREELLPDLKIGAYILMLTALFFLFVYSASCAIFN